MTKARETKNEGATFYARAAKLWWAIGEKVAADQRSHRDENAGSWGPTLLPWTEKRAAYALLAKWSKDHPLPPTLLEIFRAVCGEPPLPGQKRLWDLYECCIHIEARTAAAEGNWPLSGLSTDALLAEVKRKFGLVPRYGSPRRTIERWRGRTTKSADYRARVGAERDRLRAAAERSSLPHTKTRRRSSKPDPRLVEAVRKALAVPEAHAPRPVRGKTGTAKKTP
jgi:hypothetical protein